MLSLFLLFIIFWMGCALYFLRKSYNLRVETFNATIAGNNQITIQNVEVANRLIEYNRKLYKIVGMLETLTLLKGNLDGKMRVPTKHVLDALVANVTIAASNLCSEYQLTGFPDVYDMSSIQELLPDSFVITHIDTPPVVDDKVVANV